VSLRSEDRARYDALLERVDAADLRFRFGRSFEELPVAELERLTRPDGQRAVAFVATAQLEAGSPEIVGEVRARANEYGGRSEFVTSDDPISSGWGSAARCSRS